MSHEALFAAWEREQDRSPERLGALVASGLGVELRKAESEALAAALTKGRITEWNHLLDNPEGLLGQICGNHTGIGWTGTTHTTDPTLVSAIGPQAERFGGMVVNAEVHGHLVEMLA
jgi:alkaline phosphatase